MSWSVTSQDKTPLEAKKELEQQFANAKASTAYIPSERRSVENAERTVNDALDFMHEQGATQKVQVSAFGSACCASGPAYPGSLDVSVVVKRVYEPLTPPATT